MGEAEDGDLGLRVGNGLLEKENAFFEGEERGLARTVGHPDHDFIEKGETPVEHVEVSVGDRIECAWVHRPAYHRSDGRRRLTPLSP
jgi:hypothetical protein